MSTVLLKPESLEAECWESLRSYEVALNPDYIHVQDQLLHPDFGHWLWFVSLCGGVRCHNMPQHSQNAKTCDMTNKQKKTIHWGCCLERKLLKRPIRTPSSCPKKCPQWRWYRKVYRWYMAFVPQSVSYTTYSIYEGKFLSWIYTASD